MRVSQRLDYTLRMLVALAGLPEGATTAAGDLATALGLPRRFGEQQMTTLAKATLVESRRGAGGGVSLARPAADISVLEVVRALPGEAFDVPRVTGSATAEFWHAAAQTFEQTLAATSIAELARRQAELDAMQSPMYFI